MIRRVIGLAFLCLPLLTYSQEVAFKNFLADSLMEHATVSFYLADADSCKPVFEYNSVKSLAPASIMKLITTATALELLGPDYTFRTIVGYTGNLNKRSGRLNGNIIIRGGGDPVLGSKNFIDQYKGFDDKWVDEIKKLGIKKINGRVITDDSYYNYQPIPAKWLWEDAGNYYGAGAFGLSVFDNTYEIHFKTSGDSVTQVITGIYPEECRFEFANWLVAAGTADEGYVFAAPYSTNGWLAGKIPANVNDFVLEASIADPPLIMAKIVDQKLTSSGISVSGTPSTSRLLRSSFNIIVPIAETISPPLKNIIEVLNHRSVNMYAEHLVKELGKVYRKNGSTESGVAVINEFLTGAGINSGGMFIEDGSGLSPLDAINSKEFVRLLCYMKNRGKYFTEYFSSLPDAGKEGTLKNSFRDPVFDSHLFIKSGSMTRVRSYAGYIRTISGKDLMFCIIVNNFSGSFQNIITHAEEIFKEIILEK
jgi:D-alanyl-D-alanine carboxypeptidase/D-alanyl-D-alanine-endopeptidase (penicillin-binding protein 4)